MDLYGVACPSSRSCFAVGDFSGGDQVLSLIERWDGTHWTIVASPARSPHDSELHAVTCTSPKSCVAVGSQDSGMLIEHWNGTRWSLQRGPKLGASDFAYLEGVTCATAANCVAVGLHGPNVAAEPSNYLDGVSCVSRRECFAVGSAYSPGTSRTLVERSR